MIQLQVRYLRFGDLVLKRLGPDTFELIRLLSGNTGSAVARVTVEKRELPTLVVTRMEPEHRILERAPMPAGDRIVLSDCREGAPDCFRLTAEHEGNRLVIVLSGDSRSAAGRHHFRMFWWRAEVAVVNGDVVVRGPSLAADSYS